VLATIAEERVGVWGVDQEPVLVDWRAPVAEPSTGPPVRFRWASSDAGTS
jgi:hypothetical protein